MTEPDGVTERDRVLVLNAVPKGVGTSRAAGRQGSAMPLSVKFAGTAVRPSSSLPKPPQQATPPSVDRAHLCAWAPITTATWPDVATDAGMDKRPSPFSPQHANQPAADSAHVMPDPATTASWPELAADAGTIDCPPEFQPQQATPPATERAHVCQSPAVTATWPDVATCDGTLV